jgi:ribosomal-protein-alanine N-acetyltransferase
VEGLTIRPLAPEDAGSILRITREAPEAASWPVESLLQLPGWVAAMEGKVVGFVIARAVADEMEILNLAVEPAGRRQGIGGALLDNALAFGRRSGARRAFLEVRESNRGARRFYERHEFAVIGRRPRYYRDPIEDALVMARGLEAAA